VRYETLLAETDRLDSANLTMDDVMAPSGFILLGLTLDPRTGLGPPREYFDLLLAAVRERTVEEVLNLPEVRERTARMREQDQAFRDAVLAHSRCDAHVVVTDLRPLDTIPAGNRFLVFTLFPQANVAVRVQWGPRREKVAVSTGRSIFNRTSRANLGVLMSLYGGGGHAGAGACTLAPATADARIADIVATLKRNG
jgi:nanoRNase/pAp phosphatase (c-di-AMP/oligoRNAs hydrolase)